jgi:hypothetical protein
MHSSEDQPQEQKPKAVGFAHLGVQLHRSREVAVREGNVAVGLPKHNKRL